MSDTDRVSLPTEALVRQLRARTTRNHVAGDKWATLPDPLCQAAADRLEAMAIGLNEVRAFLNKPEWGTYRYMEGSEVYEDKDAALFNIAFALGETEVS